MVCITRATDEMRNGTITPVEFLKKIANIDSKIMKAVSEDDLSSNLFTESVIEKIAAKAKVMKNCILCQENEIEVLFMPCSHSWCCKKMLGITKK